MLYTTQQYLLHLWKSNSRYLVSVGFFPSFFFRHLELYTQLKNHKTGTSENREKKSPHYAPLSQISLAASQSQSKSKLVHTNETKKLNLVISMIKSCECFCCLPEFKLKVTTISQRVKSEFNWKFRRNSEKTCLLFNGFKAKISYIQSCIKFKKFKRSSIDLTFNWRSKFFSFLLFMKEREGNFEL